MTSCSSQGNFIKKKLIRINPLPHFFRHLAVIPFFNFVFSDVLNNEKVPPEVQNSAGYDDLYYEMFADPGVIFNPNNYETNFILTLNFLTSVNIWF